MKDGIAVARRTVGALPFPFEAHALADGRMEMCFGHGGLQSLRRQRLSIAMLRRIV